VLIAAVARSQNSSPKPTAAQQTPKDLLDARTPHLGSTTPAQFHAKGIFLEGSFTPAKSGRKLSRSPIFEAATLVCTAARVTSAATRCKWPGMPLARSSRRHVPEDVDYVRSLGAHRVIDLRSTPFESAAKELDVVVDTVGGETLGRSFGVLKSGGVLVSSVSVPDQDMAARHRVRGPFFLAKVTAEGLTRIARLIREPKLERVERIDGGIPWHVGLILDHGL
jgi:hypothetical protein